MARARRVSLFQREIRISLSSAALDILYNLAQVLSEGGVDGDAFYGSVMVTIDLSRAADLVSDHCDDATTRRVADLIASDKRIRDRALRLGEREAERLAGCPLGDTQIDLHVRRTGSHLHIDMDIEASLEA